MFIIDLLPTRVYPLVEIGEGLSYTVLREKLHTVDYGGSKPHFPLKQQN